MTSLELISRPIVSFAKANVTLWSVADTTTTTSNLLAHFSDIITQDEAIRLSNTLTVTQRSGTEYFNYYVHPTNPGTAATGTAAGTQLVIIATKDAENDNVAHVTAHRCVGSVDFKNPTDAHIVTVKGRRGGKLRTGRRKWHSHTEYRPRALNLHEINVIKYAIHQEITNNPHYLALVARA
jgi:hypothetical protein